MFDIIGAQVEDEEEIDLTARAAAAAAESYLPTPPPYTDPGMYTVWVEGNEYTYVDDMNGYVTDIIIG